HVPVDNLRDVGASARPAEGCTPPRAAGDELEGPGGNFLAGTGHANDDRLAPALVRTFQRLAHHLHIADAFETVIGATTGQIDQMLHQIALDLRRVDEMGHAELLAPGLTFGVQVDAHDHARPDQAQALQNVEADAAQSEDNTVRSRLDFRRID